MIKSWSFHEWWEEHPNIVFMWDAGQLRPVPAIDLFRYYTDLVGIADNKWHNVGVLNNEDGYAFTVDSIEDFTILKMALQN